MSTEVKTLTRDEVLKTLEPEMGFQVRKLGERPKLLVAEGDRKEMSLRTSSGGKAIDLTPVAIEGLKKRLSIPEPLEKNISTRTLQMVATEALAASDLAALVKDNQVIDVVPQKGLRAMPVERTLSVIEKAVPDAQFNRCMVLPNHRIHLETIANVEKPMARGDMLRAGVLTEWSVLGPSPIVQSYVMRLVCTNGATTLDVVDKFTGGEGDEVWQWFRKRMRQACRSIDSIVARWKALSGERIPENQRAEILQGWIREARLDPGEAELVQARALNEPPRNQYDMLNLMTWVQSHGIEDPVRVSRTMRRVAELQAADRHSRICPICAHTN